MGQSWEAKEANRESNLGFKKILQAAWTHANARVEGWQSKPPTGHFEYGWFQPMLVVARGWESMQHDGFQDSPAALDFSLADVYSWGLFNTSAGIRAKPDLVDRERGPLSSQAKVATTNAQLGRSFSHTAHKLQSWAKSTAANGSQLAEKTVQPSTTDRMHRSINNTHQTKQRSCCRLVAVAPPSISPSCRAGWSAPASC
jgi:hypothetical protein